MRTAVVDASALVALLTGTAATVDHVAVAISDAYLSAPTLMPFEVSNTLRRLEARKVIDPTRARLAYDDLADLPVDLWPLDAVVERVWALRRHLSVYDASYVAIAEELEVPLVTADVRLSRAQGPRCEIVVVPAM